jgi:uncharacterized LabA/DUF88 family protein
MSGERRSWMLFVDGENFTIRGQEFAQTAQIKLSEGSHYGRDCFLWLPKRKPTYTFYPNVPAYMAPYAVRAYFYTSFQGEASTGDSIRQKLWDLRFTPRVYKKVRQREKAKGVDISLTKDMLSHAFLDHYEVACLITGDGDYIPLVEEVKRLGKIVVCMFFGKEGLGLNPELKLACDEFYPLDEEFQKSWAEE